MRDFPLSASQVCAAAPEKVTFTEAQAAVYLASASDRPIADLCEAARLSRRYVREMAFRWGIRFEDFDPFAAPKRLDWRKAEPGWVLLDGEDEIGECKRLPDGKYCARLFSQTECDAWDSRTAMRFLGAELNALSPDLPGFDGQRVMMVLSTDAGLVEEYIYPTDDAEVSACRDALQFRTMMLAAA